MSITPSAAPAFLTLAGLQEPYRDTLNELLDRMRLYAQPNFEANAYYEARVVLESPGFTIPAHVADQLAPVAGAPAIVVDALDERLEFAGWDVVGDDDYGLQGVYDDNELGSEAPMMQLDSLIYGVGFVRVGSNPTGGSPLVTMHSPNNTTTLQDPVTRRAKAAWTTTEVDDDGAVVGVLDLPDESITLRRRLNGTWFVEDRDEHMLGRVPCVAFPNRPRTSRRGGRSEITPAIRSLTEDMMRAGLGMNVNTMFYSIPQLMLLGRGPDAFTDRNGNPVPGWRILAGHALAIDKDEEGDTPTVHQLDVSSPQPFIEQLREFRAQVAAEAGMPLDYFGIQTANPASADSISRGETRLVKRAERRQGTWGGKWMEVGRLTVLVRDGGVPDEFNSRVAPEWMSAATPTRAATADEVTKLVGAGILSPTSAVVRKRLGLSRSEQRILEAEQRTAAGNTMVRDRLRAAAEAAAASQAVPSAPGADGQGEPVAPEAQ